MQKLFTLVAILIFIEYSCVQKTPEYVKRFPHLEYDTASIAILPFQELPSWIFDSTYVSDTLLQAELFFIDEYVTRSVEDFNNWQILNNSKSPWNIDLDKWRYRKQIIVARNRMGEKEVWVNCFCDSHYDSWRSSLVKVEDGGTCHFNFKVNLTLKKFYDFHVNPAA